MAKLTDKLKHAWNAFKEDEARTDPFDSRTLQSSYGIRPDRTRFSVLGDKSIVGSIYNRISIDLASIDLQHVRLDPEGRLIENLDSNLDKCLNLEANIDQSAQAFKQDIALTLFEQGVAAIVPVDTTLNPNFTGSWDILSMRVGVIVAWYPQHVRVSLYNDRTGLREEVVLNKRNVAIVENPLYSVMNEPNSTLQRLIRKLSLLDAVDEQSSSGKLDIIIQLPYVIKTDARREQAEKRRSDIEEQLKGSKYGIAYTDGTERITQLNRPAENNLWAQVTDLTEMLYTHLGLTPEIMNGTASETAMLNYYQRTIRPIMNAVSQAMQRTFLTKTARTQGQAIAFYRNPFQLIPISQLADIADKLIRNEVVTSNEIRGFLAMKPSTDPKADQLNNPNMPAEEPLPLSPPDSMIEEDRTELQNGS